MADDELSYESVLCVKPEVHVYRIPPVSSNRGHRAAEWKLDQPAWSGRMRITAKGNIAYIKLEDKTSGELFAQAPVEQYPGISVESVVDSSRYFVIRIQDGTGRHAFIGIGFADRGDSFDFNVALQDHFKWVKQEGEIAKQAQTGQDAGPKLDLGFKDGQTIKINIGNIKKKDTPTGAVKSRPTGSGLLPPPPGSKGGVTPPTLIQPPLLTPPPVLQSGQNSNTDLLFDLSAPAPINSGASGDLWGDFAAAPNSEKRVSQGSEWVQF
uniref:NECAP endocytosis associated 2 n=1 Tax=Erpetoichthys calabaricus TaxID=27687 RepID=A0A8C4X7Q7_ERPCA